jgi:hypothetical protein
MKKSGSEVRLSVEHAYAQSTKEMIGFAKSAKHTISVKKKKGIFIKAGTCFWDTKSMIFPTFTIGEAW